MLSGAVYIAEEIKHYLTLNVTCLFDRGTAVIYESLEAQIICNMLIFFNCLPLEPKIDPEL